MQEVRPFLIIPGVFNCRRLPYASMMTEETVEIIPAQPEDQPALASLLELYIHDFSSFLDLKLGPDGRFGCPRLPLYWTEPGRHPFLIHVGGGLAG